VLKEKGGSHLDARGSNSVLRSQEKRNMIQNKNNYSVKKKLHFIFFSGLEKKCFRVRDKKKRKRRSIAVSVFAGVCVGVFAGVFAGVCVGVCGCV